MNHPVDQAVLNIEGDPTSWYLHGVLPQDPGWHHNPVAINITRPVAGTLILSPARVGSFALTHVPVTNGWHPGDVPPGSRYLYTPTANGLTATSPGYVLAAQYSNLPALQESIMEAMSGKGSNLTVNITSGPSGGVVILNGARLPFAVLYEAA